MFFLVFFHVVQHAFFFSFFRLDQKMQFHIFFQVLVGSFSGAALIYAMFINMD